MSHEKKLELVSAIGVVSQSYQDHFHKTVIETTLKKLKSNVRILGFLLQGIHHEQYIVRYTEGAIETLCGLLMGWIEEIHTRHLYQMHIDLCELNIRIQTFRVQCTHAQSALQMCEDRFFAERWIRNVPFTVERLANIDQRLIADVLRWYETKGEEMSPVLKEAMDGSPEFKRMIIVEHLNTECNT